MGRNGPAFLAYPNFQVYLKWNQSLNYATTAAYLATRIEGAPAMSRGSGGVPPALTADQMKELQRLLARRGYDVGEPDGRLGAGTRAAVKDVQRKLGLPADSYPTAELLERLQRQSGGS
jgi:peptidoglycan hydrolase-like protein with peptidoglycan-binding domain